MQPEPEGPPTPTPEELARREQEQKQQAERDTAEGLRAFIDTGLFDPYAQQALKQDPKAYGMKASRPVVERVAQYLHEQGLTEQLVDIDEVFARSTLDL